MQLPVLHITRYHLLLQRYLKLIDRNEEEKTYLLMLDALNFMKKVNVEMNSNISVMRTPNRIMDTNNMQHLIATYGKVLKEVAINLIW